MTAALELLLAAAERREGVYYLTVPERFAQDEERYRRLRAREGRLYPDAAVRSLPGVPPGHPLAGEWAARADSLVRLTRYVSRSGRALIVLDLGCGNGWLAHHLAALHEVAVYGVDLNQAELAQAARVFAGQPRLHFVYADVFTAAWPAQMCDLIIVASAIQYFPDLPALVRRLLALLTPRGEVHLLDSPLYHPAEAPAAQARTRAYYAGLGCADMAAAYHHHTFTELAPFAPELLYNPAAALNRFARRLGAARSPFPWLRLKAPA